MRTRAMSEGSIERWPRVAWMVCSISITGVFVLTDPIGFGVANAQAQSTEASPVDGAASGETKANTEEDSAWPVRERRNVAGWELWIHPELIASHPKELERAVELLTAQLEEIVRVVPAGAVAELKKVKLFMSPPVEGDSAGAEYHPSRDWLIRHHRDPAMTRSVEFTNIMDFEAETRRMPNFALHELAHAYHDRALDGGFDNEAIKELFERAVAGGTYDRVERQDSAGNKRMDRSYAVTSPQEYFAESTEAYFSHNDFYPYDAQQLRQHDPQMFHLLSKLWGN